MARSSSSLVYSSTPEFVDKASGLLEHARREAIARGRVPALEVVITASAAVSQYRGAGWREIGQTVLNVPGGREIEELVFLGPDE